jgi:two-component system response regulator MtrA
MGKVRTTLLLVGAETGVRRELVPALVGEGYVVDVARSGGQALALLAERPAQLVLSCLPLPADPMMPIPLDDLDDLEFRDDPAVAWPDLGSAGGAAIGSAADPRDLDAARLDELVFGSAGPPSTDRLPGLEGPPGTYPAGPLGPAGGPPGGPANLSGVVPAGPAAVGPAGPSGFGPAAPRGAGLLGVAPVGVSPAGPMGLSPSGAAGRGRGAGADTAEMDGLEFCRRLRAGGDVPLVVVGGRSTPADVVAGLEAGADDHVTAPPVTAEMFARLRALLRRVYPSHAGESALRVGDLQIRPAEGVVRRQGEDQHLTRTEFRLLCELAVAGGRAVSRKQLLERVWGYDYFGGARMLDVHVRRLRRKLEMDPSAPTHILTVRGIGYRVCTAPTTPKAPATTKIPATTKVPATTTIPATTKVPAAPMGQTGPKVPAAPGLRTRSSGAAAPGSPRGGVATG